MSRSIFSRIFSRKTAGVPDVLAAASHTIGEVRATLDLLVSTERGALSEQEISTVAATTQHLKSATDVLDGYIRTCR